MTVATWNASRRLDRGTGVTLASCAVFVAYVCARLAVQLVNEGVLHFEDDAYYYTKIARNILETGLSTFDGQTLTNGYQPLWLLVVGVQELVFGQRFPHFVVLVEVALAAGALWLFLTSLREKSPIYQLTFTVAYTLLAWPMIAKGMELSLLLFCLAVFTSLALQTIRGQNNVLWLGLAGALCIGARIDAAVFVLPILVLACGGLRRALPALMFIAGAGALYAAVNFWLFGTPVPISGSVKALGGFQLNRTLLEQVWEFQHSPIAVRDWPAVAGTSIGALVMFANSTIGRLVLMSALALVAVIAARRDPRCAAIGGGYLIGIALFATKLLFFSVWELGSWYAYPAVLALFVVFLAADDHLSRSVGLLRGRLGSIGAVGLVLALALQLQVSSSMAEVNRLPINLRAIAAFDPIFKGDRVAMGDIAGSFGLYYAGPVTQLEGLVNDREYLDALKGKTDLKQLLCTRGVRYVVSYETDLGDYETAVVPALRPKSTHYPGPVLTLSRADEVGRVFAFKTSAVRQADVNAPDRFVYAWRLTGCPMDARD